MRLLQVCTWLQGASKDLRLTACSSLTTVGSMHSGLVEIARRAEIGLGEGSFGVFTPLILFIWLVVRSAQDNCWLKAILSQHPFNEP